MSACSRHSDSCRGPNAAVATLIECYLSVAQAYPVGRSYL